MSVYRFIIVVVISYIHGTNTYPSLNRRYESSQNGNQPNTISVNIDGERVAVELPVDDVPPNIPRNINTLQYDQRIDDKGLIILPSSNRDDHPVTSQLPTSTVATDSTKPPVSSTSSPDITTKAVNAVTPSVTSPAVHVEESHPSTIPSSITQSTVSITPTSLPHHDEIDHPTTHSPNTTSPPSVPHPSSTESHPSSTHRPTNNNNNNNNAALIISAGWLPIFGNSFIDPFSVTNDIFGTIYPIYTSSPMVIQYIAAPTMYYIQAIKIISATVPHDSLPLNSIMELAMAITHLLRTNAESLNSVSGPDGNTRTLISQDNTNIFHNKDGDPFDIPMPNDVTTQIHNAVQEHAGSVPEEVQDDLTRALSENIAELLKPLYQNIAYTRKLRLDDGSDSNYKLSKREYRFLKRRADPPAPVVVPAVATGPVLVPTVITPTTPLPAVSPPVVIVPNGEPTTINANTPTTAAVSNIATTASSLLTLTTPLNTPHPLLPSGPTTVPTLSLSTNPTSIPAVFPSMNNYPVVQTPVTTVSSLDKITSLSGPEVDLIKAIISAPNSALSGIQTMPNILSIIPNPLKCVYSFMSTIATVYPNIQLSVLVGLATVVTQILATVLQTIAGFIGIFAALPIGKKRRRDISSDTMLSPEQGMKQVIEDLHKDIKTAVETYVPEAPKETKKKLTSALYQDSLETINSAYEPMEKMMKEKNQENGGNDMQTINDQVKHTNTDEFMSRTNLGMKLNGNSDVNLFGNTQNGLYYNNERYSVGLNDNTNVVGIMVADTPNNLFPSTDINEQIAMGSNLGNIKTANQFQFNANLIGDTLNGVDNMQKQVTGFTNQDGFEPNINGQIQNNFNVVQKTDLFGSPYQDTYA